MYVCVYICSMCVCVCVHVCMCVCICMRHGERSITALVCVWAQRQRELRCLRTLGLRSAPLSAAIPHLSSCSTPAPSTPPPLHPSPETAAWPLSSVHYQSITISISISFSVVCLYTCFLSFSQSPSPPYLPLSFFLPLSISVSFSLIFTVLSLSSRHPSFLTHPI